MSSLLFGDSYFEVDSLKDSKLGIVYFIRQVNIIEQEIACQMDYTFKETFEYQLEHLNAKYYSCGDGHGFIGYDNEQDATNAANWLESLLLAATLRSKNFR